MSEVNRRTFVMSTAGTLAASTLATGTRAAGPNDTIRAAVLGVNGRGMTHVGGFLATKGVTLAVLCDPDSEVLAKRAKEVESKRGVKVETEIRLAEGVRTQGHRRRQHRDAEPLALAGGDLGVSGGQGCLRREARHA